MPLSLLSLAPQCAIDTPPHPPSSSSLLLNDILLPLAPLPLSGSILHKSVRPLYPSKANDHHLFPSTAVTLLFFFFLFFSLPLSPSSATTWTPLLTHIHAHMHMLYVHTWYLQQGILHWLHNLWLFKSLFPFRHILWFRHSFHAVEMKMD